jgi:DNA-directed RNA polymerase beta subunit/intein/homing endonuclease
MRRVGDYASMRSSIFSNALDAVSGIGPIENARYRLHVSDLGYGKQTPFTLADSKSALLEGRTLAHRLVGTVTLTDRANNNVVDTRRMTLASVPYVTDQGTFILDGSPMAVSNQMRLDPGVFTRRKSNGAVEAHVNVMPGNGTSHRVHVDPKSGVLKVTVAQAELPAVTLLRLLGATDQELRRSWGSAVADVNFKYEKDHHLDRYWEKFGPSGPVPESREEKQRILGERIAAMKFDPWVTNRTLGRPFESYSKDAAMAVTKKIMDVFKGVARPDDRDHPAYSSVWGPEHLIADRLARSKPVWNRMLWQATNAGSLKPVKPAFLSGAVRSLFMGSGLANLPEGSNAAEFVDHGSRITKVGEGGIGRSADSVPMSARWANIGQFPFIDSVRTSESNSVGVDLRTAFGTKIGSDRRIYAPLQTPSGRIVYKSPRDLADLVVAFPGSKADTNAMIPVVKRGKLGYAKREDVDLFVPSYEQSFSPLTNMVPMKSSSKPHRSSMGARMVTQALALRNTEAPLVRTGVPGQPGRSFEALLGRHMGAVSAPDHQGGVVTALTPDELTVRYEDGTEQKHELFNHYPSGRMTGHHSTPLVKVGDRFAPGQLLVKSNQTDDQGHAAYGTNVRVAFMPWRGAVYEDSMVISRSLADRMASHHMYRHQVTPDETTTIGRVAHAAAHPGKFTLDVLKSIGDDGVVKVGTVVNNGDPLILAVRRKQDGYARLSRSSRAGLSDASELWEHDEPGTVVDSRQTPNGPVVTVETFKPTKTGDKLCYDEHTEVMTARGWVPVYEVRTEDPVATIDRRSGAFTYLNPVAVHGYYHTGRVLRVLSDRVDLVVTDNHELYAAPVGSDRFDLIRADALFGTAFVVRTGFMGLADGTTEVRPEHQTWVDHAGHVYCVTLPENHVLFVRRGGKTVWCGNSGRHGNKGVTSIVEDHEMPRDAEGRPVEAILSSLGTISRVNSSAIMEAALGKIAAKTGKPYVIHDFEDGHSNGKFVDDELAKHGASLLETVTDPKTGRPVPNVAVGNMYLLKLSHMAAKKAKGRGLGAYDETGQPVRGGDSSAMRSSLGDTMSLLSYGAGNVIRDDHLNRGQSNDAFWTAYMAGFPVNHATTSKAWDRFLTELKAAGVNPVRENGRYRFMGLHQKDIDELAGSREVENGETIDASRDNRPYPGGLFDENTFGATDSPQWGKVTLHEPMISPVFEEPVRRLLGLTEQKFRDIVQGKQQLNGRTGMAAVTHALRAYDVAAELRRARDESNGTRKTARDAANRRLGYLKELERSGRTPADWIWTSVPVLPPAYRPVAPGKDGAPAVVSDANLTYRELIEANNAIRELHPQLSDVGQERLNLYDAVKGVVGLGDPITAKNRERGVKGILEKLLGESSKASFVQQKLLGTPVDLSGRGQVLPSPDLDMDQVGLPETIAWNLYRPFVVRRLVRSGVPRIQAARHAQEQTAEARRALLEEMDERPVRVTRYPALHRYATVGQIPRLVSGDAILSNNLINKPLGLDHNGDSVLTALTPVYLNGNIFLGDFEQFVREVVHPSYREEDAVKIFGKTTTIFGFKAGVDVRVPAVMHDGRTGWFPVKQLTVHTSHGPDCYRVQTDSGLDSVFTAHHNFLKLSPLCELTSAYTSEIAAGDLLPSLLSEEVPVKKGTYKGIPLDYDTGVWFGHWLGDGSITGRDDTVSQASLDEQTLMFLEEAGKKITQARPWYEGNRHSIRWTDKNMCELIEADCGRLQPDRRVAGWMLSAPKEFREGLVVGFCMAEGHNSLSNIVIESTSRVMLLGFKMILATLGVYSKIMNGKPPRVIRDVNCKQTWVLAINLNTFKDRKFRWPDTDKSKQFSDIQVASQRRDGVWDVVPFPKAVSDFCIARGRSLRGGAGKKLREKHGITMKYPKHEHVTRYAAGGTCGRNTALQLIEASALRYVDNPMIANWIKLVDATHLIWEPVKSVEKVARPDVTYDFTVEGAETFCVDGFFLTHNTFTVNVPLSDDAVKETYEKLLPSKNLFSPANMRAKNWLPNMEYQQGLHAATHADAGNDPVEFDTIDDVKRALADGKIGYDTRVRVRSEH